MFAVKTKLPGTRDCLPALCVQQGERIMRAVKNNILFSHLDEDQLETIALAMFEVRHSDGEDIITQVGRSARPGRAHAPAAVCASWGVRFLMYSMPWRACVGFVTMYNRPRLCSHTRPHARVLENLSQKKTLLGATPN